MTSPFRRSVKNRAQIHIYKEAEPSKHHTKRNPDLTLASASTVSMGRVFASQWGELMKRTYVALDGEHPLKNAN